jgi:hypothetical protein
MLPAAVNFCFSFNFRRYSKGDKASNEELLVLSALDLCAVALRAAPAPFGRV